MGRFAAQRQRAVGVAVERRAQSRPDRRCGRALRAPPGRRCRDRTGPRPPRSCRRHGSASCRPRPTAAAMPPCAQALEPDMPGRVPASTRAGKGASFSAVNKPGNAGAQDQRAVGFDDIVDVRRIAHGLAGLHRQHAVDRPRARAPRSAGSTTHFRGHGLKRMQNPSQRDALHVRAEIAGPHEFDIGIFDRDIVAHRAFGDHHHALRDDACRHSRSWPRSSRRNRLPPPLPAGIRDAPAR